MEGINFIVLKKVLQNILTALVNPIMKDFGFKYYKGSNSFKRKQREYTPPV